MRGVIGLTLALLGSGGASPQARQPPRAHRAANGDGYVISARPSDIKSMEARRLQLLQEFPPSSPEVQAVTHQLAASRHLLAQIQKSQLHGKTKPQAASPDPLFVLPSLRDHSPSPDQNMRHLPRGWSRRPTRTAQLQSQLKALLLRRQHLLRQFSPRSPQVRQLNQQIATVRRELGHLQKRGVVLLGSRRDSSPMLNLSIPL